jgi:urease subunit alpha
VEIGKLADLVLWRPAFFGMKPGAGDQGRLHRLGADGGRQRLDPDAAAVIMRPMFGAMGRATGGTSIAFVSQRAMEEGHLRALGLQQAAGERAGAAAGSARRTCGSTTRCRGSPSIPRPTRCAPTASCCVEEPASRLPLAQRYSLF